MKLVFVTLAVMFLGCSGCSGKSFTWVDVDDVFLDGQALSIILKISNGRDLTARGSDSTRYKIDHQAFVYLHYTMSSGSVDVQPDFSKNLGAMSGSDEGHFYKCAQDRVLKVTTGANKDENSIEIFDLRTGKALSSKMVVSGNPGFGRTSFIFNRSRTVILFNRSAGLRSASDLQITNCAISAKVEPLLNGRRFHFFSLADDLKSVVYVPDAEEHVAIVLTSNGNSKHIPIGSNAWLADAETAKGRELLILKTIGQVSTAVVNPDTHERRLFKSMARFVWNPEEEYMLFLPKKEIETSKNTAFRLTRWNYEADTTVEQTVSIPALDKILKH